MKKLSKLLITISIFALPMAGCSGVKDELGLTHPPPDEFTVLKRAPLSMPPDFALRPPEPGAQRPQDTVPVADAQTAVFGDSTAQGQAAPGSSDAVLLKDTGADQASDSIRQAVDQETAALAPKQKPITERLLGWTHSDSTPEEPPATVVDPAAEATRIKTDQQQGKPVTTGDTPTQQE